MANILGLDLGSASIGWAIINADIDSNNIVSSYDSIVDAGVRIFPEGLEPGTKGTGDGEQSLNAARREFRQTRRGYYRKRIRKYHLLKLLIKHNMCPLSEKELNKWYYWDRNKKTEGQIFPCADEFIKWLQKNPYELRARALEGNVNKMELGRILYHLIHRRGFLSSRKAADEGALYKGGKGILGINSTKDAMGDKALGKYLYELLPAEGKPFRNIRDEKGNPVKARGRYTLREMYIAEFNEIWEKNASKFGLSKEKVTKQSIKILKGDSDSKRNNQYINKLIEKYGNENVKIDNHKVIIQQQMPLKKSLGGDIWIEGDTLRYKSKNSILFWQRPLRSQKHTLSKCRFEKNKHTCPLSHPDYEEFRALQFINNIKYGKGKILNHEQRSIVLNLINKKDRSFDFAEIPKKLQLTYETFNYNDKTKVQGNITTKYLNILFDKSIMEENKQDIWHCFHFYHDNELLFNKLKKDYNIKLNTPDELSKYILKDGYSAVSYKAMHNILPFLRKGYRYDIAVILGGIKNSFGDRWDYFNNFHEDIEQYVLNLLKKTNTEGEVIKQISEYLTKPEYSFGFNKNSKELQKLYHHSQEVILKKTSSKLSPVEDLRNPLVQQGINELRRLVNSLIDKYGKFHIVKVELGRDLKSSKDQRYEQTFRVRDNESKNEEARKLLTEYGLSHSRENIRKVLLYNELNEKSGKATCPYTNKTINISSVLGGQNAFQIEHIIPYSVSLDDSFANITLCDSTFNRLKGEKTPYQFYLQESNPELWGGANSWDEVEFRAFRLLPYQKARRYTSRKKEYLTQDFIQRQLNDSRYFSKKAKEILSEITDEIIVMPGNLTSELRHLWGLNNILQPVNLINIENIEADPDRRIPYYVVMDKSLNPVRVEKVKCNKPSIDENQTTIAGYIDKTGNFISSVIKIDNYVSDYKEGRYWIVLDLVDNPLILPVFDEQPESDENHIVIKSNFVKGNFRSETIKGLSRDVPDGRCWAKFPIDQVKFIPAGEGNKPSEKAGRIILFGNISNGIFNSFIFKYRINEADGQYWCIIETDPVKAELTRVKLPKPEPGNNQIVVEGIINESGIFESEIDCEHRFDTNKKAGRYYAVFDIRNIAGIPFPQFNEVPETNKGEKLIEGNIWVDKFSGEIKFDPKKNRDDNRHHAIDAVAIAVTERRFLNEMSRYHANLKKKDRGLDYDQQFRFDLPWNTFTDDVVGIAENILVSHKKRNSTAVHVSKIIGKNGKNYRSEGWSSRGLLHKQFVYGRRTHPDDNEIHFHIRKGLEEIRNNKHVEKIADRAIRNLIKKHLRDEYNIDSGKSYNVPADAFFRDGKPRIFLPNKRGEPVPVRKVRIMEEIGNAVQLKQNLNKYVNPRNNHHVMIYEDNNGNLREEVVTLWEAVNRKVNAMPVYKLPQDGKKIVTTLEINDMFLIGMDESSVAKIDWNDNKTGSLISPFLYRVQKVSSMYYTFRHHLASTINNPDEEVRIVSFKAWERLNPMKLKVDITGKPYLFQDA